MKKLALSIVLLLAMAGIARAEYWYGRPYYWHHHSSTAAEGYMRGAAAWWYAQGAYNRMTAEAAKDWATARRYEIENREMAIDSYFAMRELNRKARAAERRPMTPEARERISKMGVPKALGKDQLDLLAGAIKWPSLLLGKDFAVWREKFEGLLKDGITLQERQQVQFYVEAMQEKLRSHIRSVRPQDYSVAQQFLKSLNHQILAG